MKSNSLSFPDRIEVVDSHTEGEPTRVIVGGWPECRGDTMEDRRVSLESSFDHLRQAVICEPRGHDAIVGALLTEPVAEGSTVGVIFFNNVGYLGMCGHGLIGVVRTLEYLDRLDGRTVNIDTPVGTVMAEVGRDGAITIQNVVSYCQTLNAEIQVPEVGTVSGDVAWGGNWFFLTRLDRPRLDLENLDALLETTKRIRAALDRARLLGKEAEIDHVELFGPPQREDSDSRNFVLCPGGEYDRSPCGTGTSAKMAVLHARGELELGQEWRQESITGGRFVGWLTESEDGLVPYIRGRAWVTGHSQLLFSPDDLLKGGSCRS